MTGITLNEYYDRVIFTAQGHTGYKKSGEDIVCAAVSALCFTLLEALRDEQASQHLKLVREIVSDGYMCIEAEPYSFAAERVQAIIDTVYTGLSMLAEKYPEYVSLE